MLLELLVTAEAVHMDCPERVRATARTAGDSDDDNDDDDGGPDLGDTDARKAGSLLAPSTCDQKECESNQAKQTKTQVHFGSAGLKLACTPSPS